MSKRESDVVRVLRRALKNGREWNYAGSACVDLSIAADQTFGVKTDIPDIHGVDVAYIDLSRADRARAWDHAIAYAIREGM